MSGTRPETEQDFSMGDALQIAHNCTNDVTGNNHPFAPSSTLEEYGIKTSEGISLVKNDIRTNESIGLPAYHRTIAPNALKDVTNEWTITKLSNVIFDFSVPV